jgi:DNA invertase Pin-like site-specific DNA recombinase
MQTKVMVVLFGLFAEVERDLISERTKEGLAAARARGRLLGHPKGALGPSKLDGKEGEIRMLLEKEVSNASIAKIAGVSSTNLRHFIRTRTVGSTSAWRNPSTGRSTPPALKTVIEAQLRDYQAAAEKRSEALSKGMPAARA